MTEPQGSAGDTRPLTATKDEAGTEHQDRAGTGRPGTGEAQEQGTTRTPLPAPGDDHGKAHRFWSARRVTAGIVGLLIFAAAGLMLYDVASVRADRPAMQWRKTLARELATRPLEDTWVLVGAGVAAALGLWLLFLALTPGCRSMLPMRRIHPDVRAGLRRDAAAMVLRDRAMEVSGVRSVKVKAKRRKARVHATSHFRELADVKSELTTTLTEAAGELGIARTPSVKVKVRRPAKKG
ncbi:DUF6286 domain-containing protein [Streptomyces tsukubensis]|uniref:DUF6286 domain-containing protein n=1 Tax=Streptomyces tsukubensis TaxID=83656 RepID=A0A1V4A2N0_9ACTN|nr:DUF6286 domain-containing protein [Streptomyces tsukubensis]OON74013.1 hypothetical protein B1H18_26235 [Streptomyces tsukubensis]QFR92940.1 hypothetical protein GBW32_07460 [Streptomyces tsukubensis]